jgi:hypothetical protein
MSDEIDKRSILADEQPFDYRATKDGRVLITWNGKQVMTLKGDKAAKFLEQIADADDFAAQLQMAKATGNFKRGNER